MSEIYTGQSSQNILAPIKEINRARIFEGNTQLPFSVQKIVLDLSVARLETNPYEIKFPFKSFYVQDATDNNVVIDFKPITRDSVQSSFTIRKNDAWISDYPIPAAYLSWSAQVGKTFTIILFIDAEFQSGSQISTTSGGVAIADGISFTQAAVSLVAATPTIICSSDSTRKKANIQNKSSSSIWLGGLTVSNTNAFYELGPFDETVWRNTSALYGYSVLGATVHKTEQF